VNGLAQPYQILRVQVDEGAWAGRHLKLTTVRVNLLLPGSLFKWAIPS
jgi:hypothetical protein